MGRTKQQLFEQTLRRKLILGSILSGAMKAVPVSLVVLLVIGDGLKFHPVLLVAACITLSVVLDLLWFYRPNMAKHIEHMKQQEPRYLAVLDQALTTEGALKMVSTNWFLRDLSEILETD